jgi:hypothetical protein
LISYPYLVATVAYWGPARTGFFRRRTMKAKLELTLRAPDWTLHGGDLRQVLIRLTGVDAEKWSRLDVGAPIRIYGRPAPDHGWDRPGTVLLDITRMKRGHRNFPTRTSHRLKEAPAL